MTMAECVHCRRDATCAKVAGVWVHRSSDRWIPCTVKNRTWIADLGTERSEQTAGSFLKDEVCSMNALVVEDDKAARLILQNWLESLGYEVMTAQNGEDGWSAMAGERVPKLILLDWSVPGLDGIELCRRLRARSWPYYPYVIMIAGRNHRDDVAHALESGADDYLAKPFEIADLEARLKVAGRILMLQDQLIKDREEYRTLAMKDPLTQVWNRTAFLDLLSRELNRSVRQKTEVGLLFLDLDHFKSVNDSLGHLAGDFVLMEITRRLSKMLRSYDFIGRFGGEEFCVALPGCPSDVVGRRAEMIRCAITADPVRVGNIDIPVTVSIGATASGKSSAIDLVAVADVALYRAKTAGRNCTVHCNNSWETHSPESMKAQCENCESYSLESCRLRISDEG